MVSETPAENLKLALFSMLAAVFIFSLMQVAVKLAGEYSLMQIIFFRNLFALPPILLMMHLQGGVKHLLQTEVLSSHTVRGIILFCSMLFGFQALLMIPLADAVAMTFIAPILVTLLSIPFLSEKVGIYRWCAALLGFAGVCVVAMPTGHGEMIGYMVAFASAFLSAIVLIQIRILGRTEHSLTMVFYSTLICLLISLGGAMMYWTPPGPADFLLLCFVGIAGGVGQMFFTLSYRLGPAGLLAPFNYTAILFGALWGVFLFGETLSWNLLLGSGIIICSGLFILYRERVKHVSITRMSPSTLQPVRPTPADLADPKYKAFWRWAEMRLKRLRRL